MYCFANKRLVWFLMIMSAISGMLCIPSTALASPALKVYSASTHERGDVVYLDAQLEYSLSQAAVTALQSGVPITFKLEVEIFQPRDWLWDKVISEHVHRYQLSYHALTQQYLVTNISSGIQNSYSSREIAMLTMGRIHNLPLVASTALPQQVDLQARIKVSLDINALPTPMRPWAYISSDWKLSSEWYTWDLAPISHQAGLSLLQDYGYEEVIHNTQNTGCIYRTPVMAQDHLYIPRWYGPLTCLRIRMLVLHRTGSDGYVSDARAAPTNTAPDSVILVRNAG